MLIPRLLTFAVNAGWQGTLIAVLAALGGWLLRTSSARLRYGLFVAALVATAVVPVASLGVWARDRGVAAPAAPWAASTPSLVFPSGVGAVVAALAILAMAYRLLRLVAALWRVQRADLAPVEGPSAILARRLAMTLGVDRLLLLASASARGPYTVGQRVVVPTALLRPEASELFAAAIGHEPAHLRRHDYLVNLSLEALMVPLSFHPAAWFLKRRVDDLRELACDELVMEAGLQERVSYASALVQLAKDALSGPPLGHALGAVAPPLLEERVRVLIDPPRPRSSFVRQLALVSTLALVAVLSTGFAIPATVTTDWLGRGLAACQAGEIAEANEAMTQLNEFEQADLMIGCATAKLSWCSESGFIAEENQ